MNSRRCCRCGAHIFVRAFHTALCVGVPVTLLLKDTDLKRWILQGEDLVRGTAYLSLLLLSLSMYYIACLVDPGYLPLQRKKKRVNNNVDEDEDDHDGEGSEEDSNMLARSQDAKDIKYRRCDFCEIRQPMRARHCEDCGRCVRKYDHHCPWLQACVGERNHKFFWLFLISTTCLILWTIYITWSALTWAPYMGEWIKMNAVLLADLPILGVSALVVVGLLAFHTYLMVRGVTTWEAGARERITYLKYLDEDYNPFDEGFCRNSFHFLCRCSARRWEALYSHRANVKEGGVV